MLRHYVTIGILATAIPLSASGQVSGPERRAAMDACSKAWERAVAEINAPGTPPKPQSQTRDSIVRILVPIFSIINGTDAESDSMTAQLNRLWRDDSVSTQEALVELILGSSMFSRRIAAGAAYSYRGRSGGPGPLLEHYVELDGFSEDTRLILEAIRGPVGPDYEPTILRLACDVTGPLEQFAHDTAAVRRLNDGYGLWVKEAYLVLSMTKKLTTGRTRQTIETLQRIALAEEVLGRADP